jgi:hypothetical protein
LRLCEDGASSSSARAYSTDRLRRRFPGRDRRARPAGTHDLARRHAARLTARQHEPAVVADRPPMYLRWTPHVPGLQPTPTTCAAAGRHRCSRACEVHARYEAGTSPEAMSAVRQLEPGHAEQLSKTAASPRGCPGPSNPSDQRSGQPHPLCPPGKVSRSPGPLPQSTAHRLPGGPRSGKTRGRRADARGCTPDSAARVKPEHAAGAPRPWPSVENRRLHRPSGRPARRPLCVRGCRTTAPNSVTRRHTTRQSRNAPPARDIAANGAFSQRVAGVGFEPT